MPHGPLLLSVHRLRPRPHSLSSHSHFAGVVRKRKSRGRMRSKQREMKVMRRILKPHGACLAGRGAPPPPPYHLLSPWNTPATATPPRPQQEMRII